MIEQNAATPENAIALAIIDRHPVRIQLCHPVRAARIEWRRLRLWHCLHETEHLRRTCLVETHRRVDDAYGFQEMHRPNPGDRRRGQRLVEGDTNETLCGEIVHLLC